MIYKQIFGLWFVQFIWSTIITLATTISGLAGASLTPNLDFATVPIALGAVGTTLTTIPVSRAFGKFGRRKTLIFGAIIGSLATIGLAVSVAGGSFLFFSVSYLLFGCATAFTLSYRFTATAIAPPRHFAGIHAMFVAAGLLAGVMGPVLATLNFSGGRMDGFVVPYASAAALAVVIFFALTVMGDLRTVPHIQIPKATDGLVNPPVELAILAASIATGAMLLVMLATPLLMPQSDHRFSLSGVMSAHFICMYLPGLFGALMIRRVGAIGVIVAGCAAGAIGALAGMTGDTQINFMIVLMMIGASWGLITVGTATIISIRADPHAEGRYNLCVSGVSAVSAFGVAPLSFGLGWFGLNLLCGVAFALLVAIVFRREIRARAIITPLQSN